MLGQVIRVLATVFFKILNPSGRPQIRHNAAMTEALFEEMRGLDAKQLHLIARGFAQFLNLANIADQQFDLDRHDERAAQARRVVEELKTIMPSAAIEEALADLHMDLVLTARNGNYAANADS